VNTRSEELLAARRRSREARLSGPSTVREQWLSDHPYLRGIASLQAAFEEAALGLPPIAREPAWERYTKEHAAGVPLVRSAEAGLELAEGVAASLGMLAAAGAAVAPSGGLRDGCRALASELTTPSPAHAAAVRWVLAGAPEAEAPAQAGLWRFLTWTALQALLCDTIEARAHRLDDEQWNRPSCPICGALPVMAQLVEHAAGRRRLLSCGCCRARWGWKRLGCPHCGNEDEGTLEILEPAGSEVRLDVCRACEGYLKTYAGEGREALLLSDWSTLHLDALARDKGLMRGGESIFDL
jgi:FdhE protein